MEIKISKKLENLPRVDYRKLKPLQGNLKALHKREYDKLLKSMKEFGFIVPFFVWINNGEYFINDGHQRNRILTQENIEPFELPYLEIEAADEKEARRKLLVISSQYGKITQEGFDEFAFDLDDEWLKETVHFDALFEGDAIEDEPEAQDAEPQIDKAEELNKKWQVKTGDMFSIGDHKLLCGDSTKREDVERLMGGENADMVWTDPPYGVKYGEKMEESNPMGYKVRSIQNDNLTAEGLLSLIRSAYKLAAEFSVAGGTIYAAAAGDMLKVAIDAFEGSGFTFKWQLVWLKDQLVLSRADYHFRHENILYGWKQDASHYFIEDRTQDSVFVYDRPKRSEEHPMMKPVSLIEHMIRNSSKEKSTVYDPFSGSGSTMVAAQNLSRRCFGCEISPAYCAVILERMTEAFPELKVERL